MPIRSVQIEVITFILPAAHYQHVSSAAPLSAGAARRVDARARACRPHVSRDTRAADTRTVVARCRRCGPRGLCAPLRFLPVQNANRFRKYFLNFSF